MDTATAQMKMSVFLFCLILVAMDYSPSSAHMVPDSSLSTNELQVSNPLGQSLDAQAPPVVIVELPKPKKNKRKKQKKVKARSRRPQALSRAGPEQVHAEETSSRQLCGSGRHLQIQLRLLRLLRLLPVSSVQDRVLLPHGEPPLLRPPAETSC
uniref:Uncharacterized protein n=1 Tax=Knipowitschia caucasica TaxID=637954 RepID=A0AAV2M3D4_KNICA